MILWKQTYLGVWHVLCLSSFVCILGCGAPARGPVGKVSGKVTYQGKILQVGTVVIQSSDGERQIAIEVGEDGTFYSDEAPAGSVLVSIQFPARPPEWDDPVAIPKNDAPMDADMKLQKKRMKSLKILPEDYFLNNDFELAAEVVENQDNTIDIDLP